MDSQMKETIEKMRVASMLIPDEQRKALAEQHISQAVNSFVNKLHIIKTVLAIDEIKSAMGVGVEESTFYSVEVNSKTFESKAELNDFAQVEGERMGQKYQE
jgi:hypothetical protein